MRLAYLDEAGISRQEPVLVVAGVLIDGDRQWRKLEDRVADLVTKHILPEDRPGFRFHAKDIWSGNSGIFKGNKYSSDDRWKMLEALCDLLVEFQVPVVYGYSSKAKAIAADDRLASDPDLLTSVAFMAAFADCLVMVETWMRQYTNDAVAMLIAENNDSFKKHLKQVHRILRAGELPAEFQTVANLPLTTVVDTVHFAEKAESPMLQLADLCAFLVRGYLAKKPRSFPLLQRLLGLVLWRIGPDWYEQAMAAATSVKQRTLT